MSFEVAQTPEKGYGVFSKKKLLPGDLIVSETCLVSTASCEWTPNKTEWEARLAKHLRSSVKFLASTVQHDAFLALRSRCHFDHPANQTELGILKEYGLPLGQDAKHYGFFPVICMINHSCRPNANHAFNEEVGQEEVRAVANIEVGEEITICYVSQSYTKTAVERREEILTRFGFNCRCDICSARSEELEDSDRRRSEILCLLMDLPRMKYKSASAAFRAILQLLDEEGFHVAKGTMCRGAVNLALKENMAQDALAWAELAIKHFSVCFGEDQAVVKDLKRIVDELSVKM